MLKRSFVSLLLVTLSGFAVAHCSGSSDIVIAPIEPADRPGELDATTGDAPDEEASPQDSGKGDGSQQSDTTLAVCGNGVVESPEVCDTALPQGQSGACPTSCADQNPCTTDVLSQAGTCLATCQHTVVAGCSVGDGCTGTKQATPLTIPSSGGLVQVSGTTVGLGDDALGTCASGGASPDAVYTFTTTAALDLTTYARASTTTFKPAVYLRAASCAGVEVSCHKAWTNGALLSNPSLPAGTYFLWVDGSEGTSGPYDLFITATPPPPNGDSCATPRPLRFFQDGKGQLALDSANLGAATGGTSSFCGGSGSDIAYEFTTTQWVDFQATAVGQFGHPAVYLRASCTSVDLLCNEARGTSSQAQIQVGSLPPGSYRLIVDADPTTKGPYWLMARLDPVASQNGDSCKSPKPLVFPTSGTATESGYAAGAQNDDPGASCGGGGSDYVYVFQTTSTKAFTATLRYAHGGSGGVIYLRKGCDHGAVELGCKAAGTNSSATLDIPKLEPGIYYLWAKNKVPWEGGGWDVDVVLK